VKNKQTFNWFKVELRLEDLGLFFYALKSNQGANDLSQMSSQSLLQTTLSDGSLFESAQ